MLVAMIRPNFESYGATFNEDVPPLPPTELLEKRRAWRAGEVVRSEVVAIGTIALAGDESWVLKRNLYGANFGYIHPKSELGQAFKHVSTGLWLMARYDMSRAGADLQTDSLMHGGYFRGSTDNAPWHTNTDTDPTWLYTVVHGAGPTRGLKGTMSRDDIVTGRSKDMGYFRPEVPIGPGQRLEPVDFPPGTVLRYTIDGHASGDTTGLRLLTQTKVVLPPSIEAAPNA